MNRISSFLKKYDRYGIIRGILVLVMLTVSIFFVIHSVTYNQILKSYHDSMTASTRITASQFEDIINSNITYLYEVSELLSEYDSLKSAEAKETLAKMETGSYFSKLYILCNDGTIIGSKGADLIADSDSINSIFSTSIGFGRSDVIAGNNEIILHVPVVEGNTQLLGVLDEEYFKKKLSLMNTSGITRFMLMNSLTGEVNLDVLTEEDAQTKKHDYFKVMEHASYEKGYDYSGIRSDMLKKQSGFVAYTVAGDTELHYQSYTPTEYEGWYVIQILPENVVLSSSKDLRDSIIEVFCILVVVYLIVLFYLIRHNHKIDKENEDIRMQVRVEELANEAKTSFLSNMSHDIRTPLNAIVGLADICEMNADNADRVRECISKQKAASEHLMTLINDVLEMSRIESGKVTFEETEFQIGVSIHNMVMLLQQGVEEKKHRFCVSIDRLEHEAVIGDEQRITRALLNIISNAIKFTGNGGRISVVLNESETEEPGISEFCVTVSDNGMGMTEEFVKRIFVPFERMQDSTVSQIEGAGLGMTIAHDLVSKMGGTIDVSSELGTGTVVTVKFPMKVVDTPKIPRQYEPVFEELKDKYVVIVDNDVENVEWLDEVIRSLGMRTISTTSARDAIDDVKKLMDSGQSEIALMIFGWRMPKMNGIELSMHMREIVGNEVPIIMQTVYEFNENEKEMRKAGINNVLVEPIFRSDLLEVFYEMVNGGNDSKMAFPDFSGRRILLVDDHRVNAEIVAEYLQYTGITVDTVYDGYEAVEQMEKTPDGFYDLILMDIRMPKMDGYEATRKIRSMKSDYTKKIPIIALSANAFAEDRKMSGEVGMNGHLAKPVKYEEIYAELKKWLLK